MPTSLRARVLLAALLAVLATAGAYGLLRDRPDALIVGVGSTTEQRVLAALTAAALDQAGIPAQLRPDLGGTLGLRREGLRGQIDLWWDYTGAAWALGLGEQAPAADPVESWERVRRADEERGLVWLEPSGANATLALFVRAEDLPPEGAPRGLSWLAGRLSSGAVALCADPDFVRRRGGLDALAEAYAIDLGRVRVAAAREDRAVALVAAGRCFAGLATATSGAARAAGLLPVADELGLFPAFIVAPVAREPVLRAHPGLREALAGLARIIDTRALGELNRAVHGGEDPAELAEAFLERAR